MIHMSSLGFLCVPRLTCASRVLLYGSALKETKKLSASVKNVTTLLTQMIKNVDKFQAATPR